jgi:hypothetical protein
MSDRPITAEQAVLAAKAAGLDASPLEEQIRHRETGDEDPGTLRARIAELEAEINKKAPVPEETLLHQPIQSAALLRTTWTRSTGARPPGWERRTMAHNEKSVHDQLDELRQAAAQERVGRRELEAELEATNLRVQEANDAVTNGYASDDERAARAARKEREAALATAQTLQDRIAGVALRVERADRAVDQFKSEHAHELLREREDAGRETTAQLTRSAHETVGWFRQYLADRQEINELVRQISPGTGAPDGPASTFAWERPLKDLERAMRETSEAPAPLPRWLHRDWRTEQNEVAAREQQRRLLRRQKEAA